MKKILLIVCLSFLLSGCGETKDVEYYCQKGNLVGDKCEDIETKSVSERCVEGYTFNEETSKCENTITIAAKKVSTCPEGYFIGSDNWCLSNEVYEKEEKLNCESKNIKEDDKFSTTYITEDMKCMEKLCTKVSEDGETCEEFKETELKVKKELSCPQGMRAKDDKCHKKYWMNKKYSCEIGEMKGTNCIINDSIDMEKYCEDEDYQLNEDKILCEKITYYQPNIKK